MLILIAGITGFVGIPCARAAFARGHKVRGLARNANRLPDDISNQLESFETLSNNHDVAAMDRAVDGIDAIICAFAGLPELFMESQMLLLRAAERAGVKVCFIDDTICCCKLLISSRCSMPAPGTMTGDVPPAHMRFMMTSGLSLTTLRSAPP